MESELSQLRELDAIGVEADLFQKSPMRLETLENSNQKLTAEISEAPRRIYYDCELTKSWCLENSE